MRCMSVCFIFLLASSLAMCEERREFEGQVDVVSPASALVGINKVYAMFSKSQLDELRKEPAIIMEYRIASWIEGNWLANERDTLYIWFIKHGIKIRSSMSLFIVRGFQFKLYGKRFLIAKELKRPGWQRRPAEPALPVDPLNVRQPNE